MPMTTFVTFVSHSGMEYELEIEPIDRARIGHVTKFVEDNRGVITAEPIGWQWDSLMEMTQELRVTIVAWRSDFGN